MVGGPRIPNGLAKIKQHAALFARIEEKYGVPAPVLTAFWGLESDFGGNFGNYNILSAIARWPTTAVGLISSASSCSTRCVSLSAAINVLKT